MAKKHTYYLTIPQAVSVPVGDGERELQLSEFWADVARPECDMRDPSTWGNIRDLDERLGDAIESTRVELPASSRETFLDGAMKALERAKVNPPLHRKLSAFVEAVVCAPTTPPEGWEPSA